MGPGPWDAPNLPKLLLLTSKEFVPADVPGRQQGLHLELHFEDAQRRNCSWKDVCQAVLALSCLEHTGPAVRHVASSAHYQFGIDDDYCLVIVPMLLPAHGAMVHMITRCRGTP